MTVHRVFIVIAMLTLLLHVHSNAEAVAFADSERATIIPLHGSAGIVFTDTNEPVACFDATMLDALLETAHNEGAKVVVLDIDSSGGLDEQIVGLLEVLQRRKGQLRIFAHVKNADGPAAVLAFACSEMSVQPAAVFRAPAFASGSIDGPKVQALLEAAGLPQALAEGVVDGTLWWNAKSQQFASARPASNRQDWVLLSEGSQLVLTAQRLIECGVAQRARSVDRVADNFASISATIELTSQLRSLGRHRANAIRALTRARAEAEEGLDQLMDVIDGFGDLSTSATSRRAYGELRSKLQKSIRSIDATASNPRAPIEVPTSIMCQSKVIAQIVASLPTDTRAFSNAQIRRDTIRKVNEVKKAWSACELE